MPGEPGGVILAGVAHSNPNVPPDWPGFFMVVLGIFGCPIVYAGVALTIALLRVNGEKNWANYVIGPVILLVGLAITVAGFGFGFRLL
ncbi:hypothetical protein [Streptomyces sp. NPDC054765]